MKKRGFTLAELLLCFGIIGLVGAMGAIATKHSVERAYDSYWYTGYSNLAAAIADFEENNRFESEDTTNRVSNPQEFASHLNNIFEGTLDGTKVTAGNGISFDISKDNSSDYFFITMQVPQAKTRLNPNGNAAAVFVYNGAADGSARAKILIPAPSLGNTLDLQERTDLLPFYIDNGERDRKNIQYRSFKNVYCTAAEPEPDDKNITLASQVGEIISCSGYEANSNNVGLIRAANPRKVH